jgi:hypothetical protein
VTELPEKLNAVSILGSVYDMALDHVGNLVSGDHRELHLAFHPCEEARVM